MTSPALTPEQILAGIEPVGWRYKYHDRKWTVQKNFPYWYKPTTSNVKIEPLYTVDQITAAIASLVERLEKAERRAYELAVAIMGGEDAPGYADSVPTAALTFAIRDERVKRDETATVKDYLPVGIDAAPAWVLVPREPTPSMIEQVCEFECGDQTVGRWLSNEIYRYMISAAPTPRRQP